MNAFFKTFKAKQGDCVFLVLKDEERSCHIMIDCGHYTDEIKQFVEQNLQKRIDLLIATHIDNDHIDGLVEMLEETPDVTINKIIYNCNQLLTGRISHPKMDTIKKTIETLKGYLPSKESKEKGKVKADKATTLAETIAKKQSWWQVWQKDEYVTIDSPNIPLGGNFGELVVLSPTMGQIEKLNKDFKVEYTRLTKTLIEQGEHFDGQETLFELMVRVIAMKRDNYQVNQSVKTGAKTLPWTEEQLKNAYDYSPKNVSKENKASMAFMWEGGERKILLMGDAEPDVVSECMAELYGKRLHYVDAIKVSHHGSKHSTSIGLMNVVDSDHYFFTGGNLTDKPSLEAVMKIVKRGDDTVRTLHFNNRDNNIVKTLRSEKCETVRQMYHFEIADKNELEFEY